MKLANNVTEDIQHGQYQLTYTMSSGTAKLQVSVDDSAFQDVPLSDKSASTVVQVSLCTSKVKAVLTGDAELSINRITP